MDKNFQKFLRLGIDLAPVGVERRQDNAPYFCTPKGASIFGWAGVDGIHFCFVRGFGGMVFAVDPTSGPDYVHPLAKDFADFLRLLLACGDAAGPEQAWMWDEAQFDAFLRDNPPTKAQEQVLSQIAQAFRLQPMERPWAYIRELQSSFDLSKIRYTEDLDDPDMNPEAKLTPPPWKVYFSGNFWGHHEKDRAGTEIPLGKAFDWGGRHWVVPAAYACGRGLVLDLCMRVEPGDIRAFLEKWQLDAQHDSAEAFTREQQAQMEAENPLLLDFRPRLELNGRPLRAARGCSVCWNPCAPEGINELEAKWAVDHYGLDASYGWVISRHAFPWAGSRRPKVQTLLLVLQAQPQRVPGPHFTAHRPGDSFVFVHPVSQKALTLTVQALERQTIPAGAFGSNRFFYPTHAVAMTYTLSPEPETAVSVLDCAEGDRPLPIQPQASGALTATADAAVIGVIGGADGPTVLTSVGGPGKSRVAFSALHFEPVEGDVQWRVEFHVLRFDEASFALL